VSRPRLTLPPAEAEAIIAHARATYPRECCGLIAGQAGRVVKRYLITNIYPGDDFFEMEPSEQWAALNEIWFGDEGWELLALYHSHPVSAAYPSARDIAVACNGEAGAASYPDTFHLICSLERPEAPSLRAFLIRDGGAVTEAEVVLGDG
jgi:[CysO sulfur-carrier protein]-S-L-cysteine hydrolase